MNSKSQENQGEQTQVAKPLPPIPNPEEMDKALSVVRQAMRAAPLSFDQHMHSQGALEAIVRGLNALYEIANAPKTPEVVPAAATK